MIRRLAGLCLASLLFSLVLGCTTEESPQLCVSLLDVGQGDSLLIELPGGEHWLVDGGGTPGGDGGVGLRVLLPELRRRGISRVDKLIVTHADADHFEGLFAVVGVVDIGEFWTPTRSGGARFRRLLRTLERDGTKMVFLDEEEALLRAAPGVDAELLHPLESWRSTRGPRASKNDNSIVFSLGYGQVDFLFTGDIEREVEEWLLATNRLADFEVLKLAHHGSKSSSSPAFIRAVRPLVSMVGTAAGNRYHFPHSSVVARLLKQGGAVFSSARHGSVQVCTDGWDLRVVQRDRGRLRGHLRAWSAAEILARGRAVQARGPIPTSVVEQPTRDPTTKRGLGRSSSGDRGSSGSRGLRGTKTTRKRSSVSRETAGPSESESLIDDRTWSRRRKARNRFRPGW